MGDEKPPAEIPWFMADSIRWALGGIGAGLYSLTIALCEFHIVCIDISEKGAAALVFGLVSVVGGIVWIKKRVKLGKDPAVPLAKITSGLPPEAPQYPPK